MSKVLVTGATGFVGYHVARRLSEREGTEVLCLVRSTSDRGRLGALDVQQVVGDLTDPASLKGLCDGIESIYHCACAVQDTFAQALDSYEVFRRVNVEGTVNLAREALRAGVKRFVHLSSTAAMGTPDVERVDETATCRPTTPYGRSKREAELELLQLHGGDGLPVVILRPCLVIGRGKQHSELLKLFKLVRYGVFPFFGRRAPQRKPLLHVSDLVTAMELAEAKGELGQIYLVTSGAPYTLEQIVQVSAKILGVRRSHVWIPRRLALAGALGVEALAKVLPFNPPITRARIRLFTAHREIDIRKIREQLGYAASVTDLEQMLREVHEEFRQEGLL